MKKLLFLLLVIFISCTGQDCKDLPTDFESYKQITELVKKSSFKIKEQTDTSMSSWIASAHYYSCDGKSGYLIIKTKKGKEYIHFNISYQMWKGFKNAESKGSYYNKVIKRS